MSLISLTISPIFSAWVASSSIVRRVSSALLAAFAEVDALSSTRVEISRIDSSSSSVAVATVWTLLEVRSLARTTLPLRACASDILDAISWARSPIDFAAVTTDCRTRATVPSNSRTVCSSSRRLASSD